VPLEHGLKIAQGRGLFFREGANESVFPRARRRHRVPWSGAMCFPPAYAPFLSPATYRGFETFSPFLAFLGGRPTSPPFRQCTMTLVGRPALFF